MTKIMEESIVQEVSEPMVPDSSRVGFLPIVSVHELTPNTAAIIRNRDSVPVAIMTKNEGNKLSFQPLPGFSALSSYKKFVSNYDIVNKSDSMSVVTDASKTMESGLNMRLIVFIVVSSVWILFSLALNLRELMRTRSNNS